MSFDLCSNDTCPKCRKPIEETTIEQHPTRPDLAIHNSRCPNCGAVKTRVLFSKPGTPSPVLTA
jgi:ssDNA-binding Zn-finger/Zn-ribbon topoisomerase 1